MLQDQREHTDEIEPTAAAPRLGAVACLSGVSLERGRMPTAEALPLVTQGKGTTIFLPAEAAGVMGALGGIRELIMRQANAAEPTPPARPTGALGSPPALPSKTDGR